MALAISSPFYSMNTYFFSKLLFPLYNQHDIFHIRALPRYEYHNDENGNYDYSIQNFANFPWEITHYVEESLNHFFCQNSHGLNVPTKDKNYK